MINTEQVHGKVDQLKCKIKAAYGRLTDDDIALLDGHRDQFFGKLEEKYGFAKEAAEKRLKELEKVDSEPMSYRH